MYVKECSFSSSANADKKVEEVLDTSTPSTALETEQQKTPLKTMKPAFSTPTGLNKENMINSPKLSSLNMSGTLLTSYAPDNLSTPKVKLEQSPALSVYSTPTVLTESSPNSMCFESPYTKTKKSMFLIDFTTPQAFKSGVAASTSQSTPVKTPTRAKADLRNDKEGLLKSALKNFAIKKNLDTTPRNITFAKAQTPGRSSSSYIDSSSVIEVEISDTSYQESDVEEISPIAGSSISNTFDGKKSVGSYAGSSFESPVASAPVESLVHDEEFDVLMVNISSVLDGNDTAQDVDTDKILEKSVSADCSNAAKSVVSEVDLETSVEQKFDELLGRPSVSKTYSVKKQPTYNVEEKSEATSINAEKVMEWIKETRQSLHQECNNTEQITSSRYSDVTPNDSLATPDTHDIQVYDVTTPKVSILELETIRESSRKSSLHKKQNLGVSPVARLSLIDGNTEVMENYTINSEMPKSLRSTRKRFGKALASLNNDSQLVDTTLDANDSIPNISSVRGPSELDESHNEETHILSLDAPVTSNRGLIQNDPSSSIENSENQASSNQFIQFAESVHGCTNETKIVLELSNSEEEGLTDQSDSDGSDSEDSKRIESSTAEASETPIKFRLSENDMEDGINPLNDSRAEEVEEVFSSQEPLSEQEGFAEIFSSQELTQEIETHEISSDHNEITPSRYEETTSPKASDSNHYAEVSDSDETEDEGVNDTFNFSHRSDSKNESIFTSNLSSAQESTLFSETEFSRVELAPEIMEITESNGNDYFL